jgi:hypothetical protein
LEELNKDAKGEQTSEKSRVDQANCHVIRRKMTVPKQPKWPQTKAKQKKKRPASKAQKDAENV